MRMHLLFPLAYLAGIYGFAFFAPYLLTVVAMGHVIRIRRQNARAVSIIEVRPEFDINSVEALQIA